MAFPVVGRDMPIWSQHRFIAVVPNKKQNYISRKSGNEVHKGVKQQWEEEEKEAKEDGGNGTVRAEHSMHMKRRNPKHWSLYCFSCGMFAARKLETKALWWPDWLSPVMAKISYKRWELDMWSHMSREMNIVLHLSFVSFMPLWFLQGLLLLGAVGSCLFQSMVVRAEEQHHWKRNMRWAGGS